MVNMDLRVLMREEGGDCADVSGSGDDDDVDGGKDERRQGSIFLNQLIFQVRFRPSTIRAE